MIIGDNPWKRIFNCNGALRANQIKNFFKSDKQIKIPKNINAQLHNFLTKILNVNPQKRPTASEVLKLPFLQQSSLQEPSPLHRQAYKQNSYSHYFNDTVFSILQNQLYYQSISILNIETPTAQQNDLQKFRSMNNFEDCVKNNNPNPSRPWNFESPVREPNPPMTTPLQMDRSQNTFVSADSMKFVLNAQIQDGLSINSELLISSQFLDNLKQQANSRVTSFHRSAGRQNSYNSQASSNNISRALIEQSIRKLEEDLWKHLGLNDEIISEQQLQ